MRQCRAQESCYSVSDCSGARASVLCTGYGTRDCIHPKPDPRHLTRICTPDLRCPTHELVSCGRSANSLTLNQRRLWQATKARLVGCHIHLIAISAPESSGRNQNLLVPIFPNWIGAGPEISPANLSAKHVCGYTRIPALGFLVGRLSDFGALSGL